MVRRLKPTEILLLFHLILPFFFFFFGIQAKFTWDASLYAQSLSRVQLSVTPWTIAHQASLSTGILQARTLEWVAISCSRGSSRTGEGTCVSCIGRPILYQLSHPGRPLVQGSDTPHIRKAWLQNLPVSSRETCPREPSASTPRPPEPPTTHPLSASVDSPLLLCCL